MLNETDYIKWDNDSLVDIAGTSAETAVDFISHVNSLANSDCDFISVEDIIEELRLCGLDIQGCLRREPDSPLERALNHKLGLITLTIKTARRYL